ncbi:MAG: DUF2474 domain-containing protein [Alphaproteobacteria bacterium]|jgi:hypothetical protein|nr:MAG: DUF2474 domain-containing protein [Alphaproteobacteria bacterium]
MKLPTIEGPPDDGDPKRPLGRSLIWFGALWVGGLASVAAVAYALRALIL